MLGRFRLTLLLGVAALVACGNGSDLSEATPCASDTDCLATQTCLSMESPGERPTVVAGCGYVACASTADCDEGKVCGSVRDWSGAGCSTPVCVLPCTAATCLRDEACRASGICELTRCDEPGAPACAEHWRCEPAMAAAEPVVYIRGADESYAPDMARARGCVRVRCDEAGGYVCNQGWICDPVHAMEASGCAPRPCAESGHCMDDKEYICMPTSTAKRPPARELTGCAQRNCEEGHACTYDHDGMNLAYCDAASPLADAFGCRLHGCDELPNLCSEGYRCDPEDPAATDIGCVLVTGGGGGATNGRCAERG